MTPSGIVAGMLACECGAEGRLKQAWKDPFWIEPPPSTDYNQCAGCVKWPWYVIPTEPFQLTEWRRDLVACMCGAGGRLVQEWKMVERRVWAGGQSFPVWMDRTCGRFNDTCVRFVRGTGPECQRCSELMGMSYWPWYAMPGVDLLMLSEDRSPITSGVREPLVRRYCPLEG